MNSRGSLSFGGLLLGLMAQVAVSVAGATGLVLLVIRNANDPLLTRPEVVVAMRSSPEYFWGLIGSIVFGEFAGGWTAAKVGGCLHLQHGLALGSFQTALSLFYLWKGYNAAEVGLSEQQYVALVAVSFLACVLGAAAAKPPPPKPLAPFLPKAPKGPGQGGMHSPKPPVPRSGPDPFE